MRYTSKEMMVICAARKIRNTDIVFCGTGISVLAAVTAKCWHAPGCTILFETGAVDPSLEDLPLAVGDPRVMHRASAFCSLAETLAFLQNPKTARHVVGILGAAQIDCYGNLNSTRINNGESGEVRLPGSGGACDMASSAGRKIVFMKLERRRFVEKLDYLTSPGWLQGGNTRERHGLPGPGPCHVITDRGIMEFEEGSRRMVLSRYYPGESVRDLAARVEFPIDVESSKEAFAPTEEELAVLREKADPEKLILD
ncbi:MAG: CoA-transferase [Desulfobacteraceae bacterium]